jgi:hypothetical protein
MGKKKSKKSSVQWDSITADAHKLVYGDRGVAYSHPAVDYARTTDIFRSLCDVDLTPEEGIVFMISVKLSRIMNGLNEGHPPELLRDSIVDLAGYAECLWGTLIFDDIEEVGESSELEVEEWEEFDEE